MSAARMHLLNSQIPIVVKKYVDFYVTSPYTLLHMCINSFGATSKDIQRRSWVIFYPKILSNNNNPLIFHICVERLLL